MSAIPNQGLPPDPADLPSPNEAEPRKAVIRGGMQWHARRKKGRIAHWNDNAAKAPLSRLEFIDHFNARGMRSVYGRGDHFRKIFNLDVWRGHDGRFLVRFSSPDRDVDSISYELMGLPVYKESDTANFKLNERMIPKCLRDEYDDWILSEF